MNALGKKFTLGIVYEITENPLFGPTSESVPDRLSEFANPTEVNRLVCSFKSLGFDVEIIDGPHGLISDVDNIKSKCQLIFNKSIGFRGLERKISVPAICQLYNIPFVGTSAYQMTLARHKFHTNRLLHGLSIKVPKAALLTSEGDINLSGFHFPVIVKPNHESDAIGIDNNAICANAALARKRAEWVIAKYSQSAIIEEFIRGEEWKVSVIGNGCGALGVGIVGVMRGGKPIIDSLQTRDDVVHHTLDYYTPDKTTQTMQALKIAAQLHDIMELRDYSRTDFRIGDDGLLYCMEVSTHPDISADSSFIIAALQSLPGYDAVIHTIIKTACIRNGIDTPT